MLPSDPSLLGLNPTSTSPKRVPLPPPPTHKTPPPPSQPPPATAKASRDPSLRVAVIGGGISGLTAAATLQAKGYGRVTVFEAAPQAGGKLRTMWHDGRPYEMGAVLTTTSYPTVRAIGAALGLGLHDLALYRDPQRPRDPKLEARVGTLVSLTKDAGGPMATASGIANLVAASNALSASSKPGMAQVSPKLLTTFDKFAVEAGLDQGLRNNIIMALTGCGYLYETNVPAAYWWKLGGC